MQSLGRGAVFFVEIIWLGGVSSIQMECVGNRFRPHMMYIVYHIILDMSIFVEACKKNRKNFSAYQKFQHIKCRTSERRKNMKIVEYKFVTMWRILQRGDC